ncbi:uncharacterized protein LOC110707562 isoform X2 [Chenopodium quinoa]|uniref:uncharacterized protein LOC110707562 isoform X2 n=1 Tax=Chenopodium quinoa TaxID=63459 RepID=UPI000B76DBE9|nr:uncharacterized protein LOC110707562 isoform X2 [Chenopodium quinoa]
MGDEKDAFYVVRKGDIVGIYKNFSDCQAQPLDPSISVYKGYGLSKQTEAYLVSRGLQQAGFSISACDVQDGLFGNLSVCPFQDAGCSSSSTGNPPNKPVKLEHYGEFQASDAGCSGSSARIPPYKTVKLEHYGEYQASVSPACVAIPGLNGSVRKNVNTGLNISSAKQNCDELKNYTDSVDLTRSAHVSAETSSFLTNPQKRICELKDYTEQQMVNPTSQSCTIEFDGASKGNPGLSGAGAILRANGGSQVWLLREGVGIATNNVAEYRSVILGLRIALEKGFKHVNVRGDSLLVCNQILGKWKTKNENMANLCKEALQLKKQFQSFTIEQVPREFNSAADSQANRAINLRDGQFEIEMTSRA